MVQSRTRRAVQPACRLGVRATHPHCTRGVSSAGARRTCLQFEVGTRHVRVASALIQPVVAPATTWAESRAIAKPSAMAMAVTSEAVRIVRARPCGADARPFFRFARGCFELAGVRRWRLQASHHCVLTTWSSRRKTTGTTLAREPHRSHFDDSSSCTGTKYLGSRSRSGGYSRSL